MKRILFITVLLSAAGVFANETTITGGRMELINKGDSVIFTEGVQLNRGTDQLKSEWMQTNRTRDKVTARGNVRLFRRISSTETWQGFGDAGFYDTETGAGYLTGVKKKKAHVVHTAVISSTQSRVIHVYADRIDFFRETKRAFAEGDVEGDSTDPATNERYQFWSQEADFDGAKKKIFLSGKPQPRALQTVADGRRNIRGDTITYYTETKRMISEGNAQAVFVDEKERKK